MPYSILPSPTYFTQPDTLQARPCLATSSQSLPLLLGPYSSCPLLSSPLHEMLPWSHRSFLRPLVFHILLLSSISSHCSLKKAFLSLLAILWNSALPDFSSPFSFSFHFFSQLFVKPPQTTILPSCTSFSLGRFWSMPHVQCYKFLSAVLQALCLSDLIPWIYLPPP